MEPEHWRRVDNLFQAALDFRPERRSAFLDEACGGDQPLREEIESLLAAHQEGGFTETPAFLDGVRLLEKCHSLVGRLIGPYRVIREIGHGGMGAVYLAARADEAFRKEVAIKLIKRGLDTESVIQRFRGERQILASLHHPNITGLLDGGTTEDGLPYFVMEHILGEPIDTYCDAHKLNIVERLRLFQLVCAAVHYAHQNLVIHRDLKPGNVLVTAEGVPRLLDFGIAKLLNPGLSPETMGSTMTAARLMTPEYASPEQVRGEIITTASDVYSLGVLLYELLTGHRPYRLTNAASAGMAAEAERAICHDEPERPSVAAGGAQGRRLRGDLDNIVLMAMRKEPQRRYGSVEQLSEDIRRHLDGLPVIARSDTARYRAAKFVVRHKAGVAAAALIFLTLSAGIIATTWQARVAAAERDRARIETVKAERINAFLQGLLSFSDTGWESPNLRKDPDVKVSEVIDRAALRAETELAGQPEILASVRRTLGRVYFSQGRFDQAEKVLRAALETQIKLFGPNHREVADTSHALATVLLRKGNNVESEEFFRRILNTYRKEAGNGHSEMVSFVSALGDLGAVLGQKGDTRAAEACYREALQYAPRLVGQERAMIAIANNQLGWLLSLRGGLSEAERFFRTAIEEYRKLPAGGTYVTLGDSLRNLGTVLLRRGRYAEAEPLIGESLEMNRRLLGSAHFATANSLAALADLLYLQGQYRAAEADAREALKALTQALPKGNIALAIPLTELGLILNKTSRSHEGERDLREALDIRTSRLPAGHQLIAVTEGALGECLTTQKRYADAEPLLLSSYAAMKSNVGEQDPRTAEARERLVTLYQSWGMPKDAARYRASAAR